MNYIIKKTPKIARTIVVLAIWVFVWWIISIRVNKQVLVPSPADVVKRFSELVITKEFYSFIALSILRIVTGFFTAVIFGVVLGILTAKYQLIDELASPVLSIIKSTPVASFIILTLVWLDKQTIPAFISFLMVLPIIHGNVSAGMKNTPIELKEMTKVYNFSPWHKITKLYLPSILPYFTAGFKTALGLAWKAGIAAEVLCTPKMSIGKELYEAKVYLETVDVFTWTITVIVISIIIEKALMWSIGQISEKRKPGDLK